MPRQPLNLEVYLARPRFHMICLFISPDLDGHRALKIEVYVSGHESDESVP